MKDYRLSMDAVVMTSGSSVGTQPKYFDNGYWYKADRSGYESTAEYLMSVVLSFSNIKEYVAYEKCTINGRAGCRSKGFLRTQESFISFQRLYDMYEGGSLAEHILPMKDVGDRITFVKEFILAYTGVDCSRYLSDVLALDMLSLNTDRHFHNLGIIVDKDAGTARCAPVFDNADALLSNYNKFHPDETVEALVETVYAQPFSSSHEVQAAAAGITLSIDYEGLYDALSREEDTRAVKVLKYQMERYRSLL